MVTCLMTGGHVEWTACSVHTQHCEETITLEDLLSALLAAAGCTECAWHWGTNWVEQ